MKKSRLMILMLAVTLMLTGAVYAAWSQNVTVKGSINTGMVKIDISEAITSTNMYITDLEDGMRTNRFAWTEEFGDPIENSVDADRVIGLNLIEFFPGSVAIAEFELQNESTMPVTIGILNDPELEDFIVDEYELTRFYDGNRYSEHGPYSRSEFNEAMDLIEFKPGDRMSIRIQLTMDLNASEDVMNESRNEDNDNVYEYAIPFRFDQYNFD